MGRDVERFLPAHPSYGDDTFAWNLSVIVPFSFAYAYDKLTDRGYPISHMLYKLV